MRLIPALLLLLLLPLRAVADPYPDHGTLWVNDIAELIDPPAETRLTRALQRLRDETGVEATLLTIPSHSAYEGAGALDSFATGLFNHRGIGDATRKEAMLATPAPARFSPETDRAIRARFPIHLPG